MSILIGKFSYGAKYIAVSTLVSEAQRNSSEWLKLDSKEDTTTSPPLYRFEKKPLVLRFERGRTTIGFVGFFIRSTSGLKLGILNIQSASQLVFENTG